MEVLNQMIQNAFSPCISFMEHHNAAGHWIINTSLLLYAILSSILSYQTIDRDIYAMEKPMSKLTVLLCWLFAGPWGGVWFCLTPQLEKPSLTKIWLIFTWIATLFIFLGLTFHMFDLQYKIATALLFLLVVVNMLYPIYCISYLTDRFNAKYYLRHIETDLILANKKLPADMAIADLTAQMETINNYLDVIHHILEDKTIGTEDAKTSFFKNVLTLGRYNQLQREIGRLNTLAEASMEIQEELSYSEFLQSQLELFMKQYRVAAYRNITFCKNLLGLLKKVEGTKQNVVQDVSIQIPYSSVLSTFKNATFANIQFNSEAFSEGIISSIDAASKSLTAIQYKGETIQREDLFEAAITVGISVVTESVSGIIDLNSETTNQRVVVQRKISELTSSLEDLIPKLNNYRAQILRQVELLDSLKELNSAFIRVYEPLRRSIPFCQ